MSLPTSRIRMIMKSSLDTGQISNEVLFLMARSTEMFIQQLTEEAYALVNDGNTLKYENLSTYVQNTERLEFLLQIIPQKITVSKFKEILEESSTSESSESDD